MLCTEYLSFRYAFSLTHEFGFKGQQLRWFWGVKFVVEATRGIQIWRCVYTFWGATYCRGEFGWSGWGIIWRMLRHFATINGYSWVDGEVGSFYSRYNDKINILNLINCVNVFMFMDEAINLIHLWCCRTDT